MNTNITETPAARQPVEAHDPAAALQNEAYWRDIRERWCWTDDKAANPAAWEKILTEPGREMMMTEEERDYLASLPDVITVYRGYPGAEDDPSPGGHGPSTPTWR